MEESSIGSNHTFKLIDKKEEFTPKYYMPNFGTEFRPCMMGEIVGGEYVDLFLEDSRV